MVLNFFKIQFLGLILVILFLVSLYSIVGKANINISNKSLTKLSSLPFNIYYSKNHPLEEQVVFLTDFGAVVIVLDTKNAPESTKIFVDLIRSNYYHNTSFYRMYNNYFIQGGDPSESGIGNAGITFPVENFSKSVFNEGTIALSNKDLHPNTTGSQFFITFLKTPWLDNKYTVIGNVFSGLDILRSFFDKYETNYRGILANTIPMQLYVLQDFINQYPEYKKNLKPTNRNKKVSLLELLNQQEKEEVISSSDIYEINCQNILDNIHILPFSNLEAS
ncbi:UNVERIFIED_CONTAM: hypothetical protein PYX00_011072 [Menopon gallinae]|uniref:Peptidyl-prolyl cis-trans isomerase n=1 Tax=Menopon gallinae TaxID=328185 RepID=A0AAW2H5R9_9NEOP